MESCIDILEKHNLTIEVSNGDEFSLVLDGKLVFMEIDTSDYEEFLEGESLEEDSRLLNLLISATKYQIESDLEFVIENTKDEEIDPESTNNILEYTSMCFKLLNDLYDLKIKKV
jgi:hypothetical protein